MRLIVDYRRGNSLIDSYRYGDLYRFSRLPDFRISLTSYASEVTPDTCSIPRTVNLYIIGDSYLGKNFYQNDSVFCGVKRCIYAQHNADGVKNVILNPSEKNILLLEIIETYHSALRDSNYFTKKLLTEENPKIETPDRIRALHTFFDDLMNNPLVNQNLEFNLFEYRIFRRFKEIKASLSYKWFNKLDDFVQVSPDGKYLLRRGTCFQSDGSAFIPLSDAQIEEMVSAVNFAYTHYKSKGFDEVYLSIIPNPVTILYPTYYGVYNELIPRIQNHPKLLAKVVDAYGTFKDTDAQIYCYSDTHWTLDGFTLWLNEFNKMLAKE